MDDIGKERSRFSPRDIDSAPSAGAEPDPERIVFRRRQSDWLSDASPAASSRESPEAEAARTAAIELAKAALIARDGLTSDHSDDVGLLCEALAEHLRLGDRELTNLMAAAQLHDIGKVGVPEAILQKPGPLDEAEWEIMREHTPIGARILSAVPELREVAAIVLHSHEHWDGSGYPDGLSGDEIPLESRIVLCADAYHAVRSPRPYRAGRSAQEALKEIKANSGGQFDPRVVGALERTVEEAGTRRHAGRFSSARAAVGSRRLAALLLAMTVAGSAFAAIRGPLSRDGQAAARDGQAAAEAARPGCGEDCPSRDSASRAGAKRASANKDAGKAQAAAQLAVAARASKGKGSKEAAAGGSGGRSGPASRRKQTPAVPGRGGTPQAPAKRAPALSAPGSPAAGTPQRAPTGNEGRGGDGDGNQGHGGSDDGGRGGGDDGGHGGSGGGNQDHGGDDDGDRGGGRGGSGGGGNQDRGGDDDGDRGGDHRGDRGRGGKNKRAKRQRGRRGRRGPARIHRRGPARIHRQKSRRGRRGNAYGHRKRAVNPRPPKLPPRRAKPKRRR